MEHINGKDSSSLLASVDYSRVLHSGVSQDVLESLLREHDSAKQAEIAGLRLEVQKLTTALQQVQSAGAVNAQESTSIQAEIARLRQEFATAIASVRGLLVEGDGDLHEMQLTSLRRQVTQLEGVLESNYQRELRVAEDRETALRSEMAQMRQDLRVALETLYRMPADGADGSNDETLLVLQKQVTDLGSAMERVLREQQQAGVERENALRNEIAQMRRDLLVTLEASYQLPEDRSGELDEQFTAWRGQVAELQHIILGTQDAQERHAQMQRETIVQELTRLQEQTKEALAAIPDAERGDLQQVRSMLHHISECLSAQPREDPERLERLEREFLARNEALGVELTRLGDEVRSALDTYAGRDTSTDGVAAAAIDALRQQISDMRDALRQSNDGEQERLAERGREIQTAFAALHEELRNGLASVEESSAGGSGSEEEWQSVRHQLSDLLIRIEQSKAEQQELVKSEAVALRDEISQAGQAWQTAVDTIRESSNDSTERSAEVLTHQLNGMLEQLRMDWSAAQTEQYRQVIAQVAQLQSDIDEVSTAIQGLEPVLPVADQESERQLAVRLDALMAALETQSDRQGSMPSGGLDALQAEVAALRTEIGTALERATSQVAGAESGPGLALDDITRAIAMQLQAVSAESERLAANRDGVLRLELAQVRQEMQTAVQQQRSASSAPSLEGVAVDLTPIQAEIAALRERLEAAPGSPDSSLRDDISQLRTDLQATIDSLASTLQSNADQSDEQSTFLRSKVAELEAQLESARTTQEQLVDRRDEIAQVREDIRATIDAFLSEQNHAFEGTDSETKTLQGYVVELQAQLRAFTIEQQRVLEEREAGVHEELGELKIQLQSVVNAVSSQTASPVEEQLIELRQEVTALTSRASSESNDAQSQLAQQLARLEEQIQMVMAAVSDPPISPAPQPDIPDISSQFTEIAATFRETSAQQQRTVESQQQVLQAAIGQMREELKQVLSGLTQESVDTFEKRQTQLRMDQLEMERNLAQLRQELVSTQAESGSKKKLWR